MTALEDLEEISTLEEAAAFLRKEPRKLAALANAGKIGYLKEGRVKTFPRSVIAAYISANTIDPAPANPFGLTDRGLSRVRSAS